MARKLDNTLYPNKEIIRLLKELDELVVSPVFDKINNHIIDQERIIRSLRGEPKDNINKA
jgi:hypothetical protein